jgi:hypothetical protein
MRSAGVSRLKLHDGPAQPRQARVHLIPAHAIEVFHALLCRPDQPGIRQHPEVMRKRGLGHYWTVRRCRELRNRARHRRNELLTVDVVAEHAADRTAGIEAVQRSAGVSTPERSEASGPSSGLLRCRQPSVQLVHKDPYIFRVIDGHDDEMHASVSERPL